MTRKVISEDYNEDIDLSTVELVRKQGYPIEIYSNVPTEDGYLLDVYRIPHGKSLQNKMSGNPVLLFHGLGGSSREFVVMGKERGLAYLLANKGYDVWLANARGSVYSRKHSILNPDTDADYWKFSWHEVGIYDLPAIFELMKNVTNKERFSYIGISQGTTVFYVLASSRPEYNRNVSVSICLAPVAYMAHFFNPMPRFLATFEPFWTRLTNMLGIHEAPPKPISELLKVANKIFCARKGFFQDICAGLVLLSDGYDPTQLNQTIVPVIFGVSPGASMRQVLHYAQNINSGLFREYSYGRKGNIEKYGTSYPPSYKLNKVTAPAALLYAENDWDSRPLDVHRLCKELPNCIYEYKIPHKQFNHYDFLIAKDVVELVFQKIFSTLEEYNKSEKK